MKTTKIILSILAIACYAIFYFTDYHFALNFCGKGNFICRDQFNSIEHLFSFAPAFVATAVVAFFLPQKYFTSWARFAWWGGAIVMFFVIRVNLGVYHSGGGFFNMDDAVDRVITILAYTFFIIGSAIQLLRVYLKERKQKSP